MVRTAFGTIGVAVFVMSAAAVSPSDAGQFDPLKKLREKAEQLQKKIDCAVNDKACIEKAKREGADKPPPGTSRAGTLDAKISTTMLAPMPANALMPSVVSGDYAHAAGVAMKGSRMVVTVDGQDGPLFDGIKPSAGDGRSAAVFSPDGKRIAYIGRRAGEEIAVIDGNEGPPYRTIGAARGLLSSASSKAVFLFSNDGSRVAYVAEVIASARSVTTPAPPVGRPEFASRVVLDGVAGPEYPEIGDMLFAGHHLLYVARTKEGKYVAVVDQKPSAGAPYDAINFPMGSEDGHFAFVGSRGASWTVVLDGAEGKVHENPKEQFDGQTIALSPTKGRVAYAAVVREPNAIIAPVNLYVDGRVMRTANGFNGLTFSPDGTRLGGAVFQQTAGGNARRFVFVNDWNSLDYSTVSGATSSAVANGLSQLAFSSDSKRFAFIAINGSNNFVVVDGQESTGYAEIKNFQFSGDSRRYAFEGRYANAGGSVVVVDGKEGPKLRSVTPNSLTFSPDGTRVAYAGNATATEDVSFVDGTSQKGRAGTFMPRVPKVAAAMTMPRYFVFSPDGRRLARVETLLDGSGANVVLLDGAPQTPGSLFSMPTFSADGRHFAYAAWFNQKWQLSLDGKSMPIDGDLYEAPNSLTFQEDGSLRFLTVKDNMLYRVVVSSK